ncbi:MAG: hypothetical protein FWG87_09355 [Defluviitaleaceae bacterium]|nr:hypothetical protein [Defluviitaleaceae bacterium]
MRKAWFLAVILVVVLAFAACGSNEHPAATPVPTQAEVAPPPADNTEIEPVVEVDPADPTEADPAEADPVEIDPVEADPTESDPAEVDPIEADPTEADPTEVDPVEADPTEADPVEADNTVVEVPEPTPPAQTVNQTIPTGETVIYTLANDEGFQGMEIGETGNGGAIFANSWYMMDAGQPQFTVVQAPGGHKGFRVHDRGDSWGYAVDFRRNLGDEFNPPWDMNTSANTYRIVARGTAPAGTTMLLQASGRPWSWLFTSEADADGNFLIHELVSDDIFVEFTSPTDPPGREVPQFNDGFRVTTIQDEGAPIPDYVIHDFIVTLVN